MRSLCSVGFVVAITLCSARPSSAEPPKVLRPLVQHLIKASQGDGLSNYYQAYVLTRAASAAKELGDAALANQLLDECLERLSSDPKVMSGWSLTADCAVDLGRLHDLEKIATSRDDLTDSFHEAYLLARLRTGDDKALEQYLARKPKIITFYDGLNVAKAFTKSGQYEKCDEFVQATQITEENSPVDMITIAYENIARKLLKEGDRKAAAVWAKKAFEVGGRQFYTGYGAEVLHRQLQGTLTKDYEALARRALAYRGHMAQELTLTYTSALVANGHYEIARKVAKGLDDPNDQESVLRSIIVAQAQGGDFRGAFSVVRDLKSNAAKNSARLAIALGFARAGREQSAREIADQLHSKVREQILNQAAPDEEQRNRLEASIALLLGIYAVLDDVAMTEQVIAIEGSDKLKTTRIIKGIEELVRD